MQTNFIQSLPNYLTFSRIICLPILILVYEANLPAQTQAITLFSLFVLLSATDWLDGFLARRLNIQTALGAFLDPVADKILVVSILLILLDMQVISYIPALILVLREIFISALRAWVKQSKAPISVNLMGKAKTASQMIAISLFLIQPALGFNLLILAHSMLWLAAGLSLVSMLIYTKQAFKDKQV